jgi:hypothetical protein
MNFRWRYICFLSALICSHARADGIELRHGRIPSGEITVLQLTQRQMLLADLIHRCHTDNTRTPYVFTLSPKQVAALKRTTGIEAAKFAIVDSFLGDTTIDLEVNVAVRYSRNMIEVPNSLVTAPKVAQDWEMNTIGWTPNPLSGVDPLKYANGGCPH